MINTGENYSIKRISSEKQEYEVSLHNTNCFQMLAAKPGVMQFHYMALCNDTLQQINQELCDFRHNTVTDTVKLSPMH